MLPRWTRAASVAVVLVAAAPLAAADPLRLTPKAAGTVVVVENPRALVEAVRGADAYRSAKALPVYRDLLESTPARRFFQLVEYYETALGAKWPDLLDRLAGGGLVLGIAIAPDPAPTLLVAHGTDEPTAAKFFQLAVGLLEDEAARAGGPDAKARRAAHHGVETVHLGAEFHAARVGPTLFVANQEAALHAGLDLAAGRSPGGSLADVPGPKAARKLLGGEPLAWLWNDFAAVKTSKQGKDFFAATRKDFLQTLVLGGSIDAFRRSDFVAAGLYRTPDGFRATLRLPAKRTDLPQDLGPLHAPPAGTPGSLPLLEPPGGVYSQSFYLDLGHLWADRKALMNEQTLADVEKAEKDISRILPNTTLGQVLTAAGPYHRVVAVGRDDRPYNVVPDTPLPPFAVVTSMRDPQFGRTAASALRAAGLLATLQYGLRMSEETVDGVKVVSYRFAEDLAVPDDPGNVRFNFVPSFAVVGDHLVTASRPWLVKDLIPLLKKPTDPKLSSPAVWRAKGYGQGGADLLRAYPDPLVTDAVLSDGVGLDEAKKRVEQLAAWVGTLGTAAVEIDHQPDAFQVQVVWKTGK